MKGDKAHRAWKWMLVMVSPVLLIFSLFLIAQGPEVIIFEESLPVTRFVTTTMYVTRQVPRSELLFSGADLLIPTLGYRYSGPYRIDVGKTLKIAWAADTSVNVYILNDVDWQSRFFGAPTRWRSFHYGREGSFEFYIQRNEPIYVQVLCPTWCSAKLYYWEEKVEWNEDVVDVVTDIVPVQTEIIQTRTELQTSRVTVGYFLAAMSGSILIIGIIVLTLRSNVKSSQKVTGEDSHKLLNYQEYVESLRRLMVQRNLLKEMFERGEIDEDVYRKLENELAEKISSMTTFINKERTVCENELKSLQEKTISLQKRMEELRVKKYLGIIEENEFEREMQLILKSFESIKKRRDYLRSLLETLKMDGT